MDHISFVMPYYMNPTMLAEQYRVWSEYPQKVKERIDVVIVDDGSPQWPALDVPRPDNLPALQIYRVGIDKPWNQHGARNLGARVAPGPWLFLTDMDHVLPCLSVMKLLDLKDNDYADAAYTFQRLDAPDLKPKLRDDGVTPSTHPNTYLMTKQMYWKVGGYDEDYCGVYGTDGLFRDRLFRAARRGHFKHVPVVRYPREVIADASTTTLPRKEGREPNAKAKVRARKEREGRAHIISTIAFPWERQL